MNHYIVKNLSVHYDKYYVLKNLNLKINKGEFIVIVGESGSGKTTFLKALANLIPYSGKISISKNKGMVFQQYGVFPWLTVRENILFGISDYEQVKKEKIISELLQITRLEDKKNEYPNNLSGGQKQRVAIARSIAPNPELLLMDEPFGSLDSYTRSKMQEWLLYLWSKYKKTIIFVTHDIEEAIFLADRIIILNKSKFRKNIKIPFSRPRLGNIKFTKEFNQIKKDLSDY
ncbi:MAG: ABC transporter ATP-binding protein [Candidatus Magasanikbacteria bacterium CG10_big_fil_rev_8_21_14_0_10_40_10]|uniref:ABC transporter ATP-binding protein n=1 Tax=Candidatus Magasanikbacteria bacterium CG10_big_fil_rev_8_21_14_0_10_40_10 TaxID=1974648 RepID=A0A2M6W322_9BACT|nr:MAG: ABC transporter ATP-binding protein [Candidatus Magasanikbacteria bacterium CG10_big_fil_rev_8_21_14_0_10_40_10]